MSLPDIRGTRTPATMTFWARIMLALAERRGYTAEEAIQYTNKVTDAYKARFEQETAKK